MYVFWVFDYIELEHVYFPRIINNEFLFITKKETEANAQNSVAIY